LIVPTNNEIIEIKKKLEEHDKRIEKVERFVSGKRNRAAKVRKSILDHLVEFKSDGFFNDPRFLKEIVEKLAQEGYHYRVQSLTEPLQRAVRRGVLGRIKKEGKWAYCKR